jgi:hypothetical protein
MNALLVQQGDAFRGKGEIVGHLESQQECPVETGATSHPFEIGMDTGYRRIKIDHAEYIGDLHDSNELLCL